MSPNPPPPRIPMKPHVLRCPPKPTKPCSHNETTQPQQNHGTTPKPGSHEHKPAATNATCKPQMTPCNHGTNGTRTKGQPKVPAYPLRMCGPANDHMPAAILLPQIHMSDPQLV
ncbi:hypothetical protein BS47DRAFT_1369837 [Hydnum rufescens UP504]|uniref:Uncharacterized protein n=1 Tax=Hydnum rufescens UP504 TaxID=1448309 RepID=A0A9P6AC46_9AGAM|nr:hypothetical protein BS47DRAFT_1369837 [Hydnum rufescens UP504]